MLCQPCAQCQRSSRDTIRMCGTGSERTAEASSVPKWPKARAGGERETSLNDISICQDLLTDLIKSRLPRNEKARSGENDLTRDQPTKRERARTHNCLSCFIAVARDAFQFSSFLFVRQIVPCLANKNTRKKEPATRDDSHNFLFAPCCCCPFGRDGIFSFAANTTKEEKRELAAAPAEQKKLIFRSDLFYCVR